MNRYTRDEIISQGLDLANCASVTQHDTPGGILQPNAWSIKWLQNALDMFHRKYPFASDIQDISMTVLANTRDIVLTSDISKYLPSDFIIDVRDGLILNSSNGSYFVEKVDFPLWLHYTLQYQNQLSSRISYYTIVNNRIRICPLLSQSSNCTLWYYALSAPLDITSEVNFPDEFTLIEFIRLKAREWVRDPDVPIGTAQSYLQKQLSGFRASGLLNEPERASIPIKNNQTIMNTYDRNAWMGKPVG